MPRYGGYTLDDLSLLVQEIESSGGTNAVPRYEPGFEQTYGAKWLREGDPAFRAKMLKQFGNEAVYSSYGAHQVMYPVAVELGFTGTPEQLADPTTNRQYFEKKFLQDWTRTNGKLRKALLRYNGGRDKTYPDRVLNSQPGGRRITPVTNGAETTMGQPRSKADPLQKAVGRAYRMMAWMGFNPMTGKEIEQILAKAEPMTAVPGVQRPKPDRQEQEQVAVSALRQMMRPQGVAQAGGSGGTTSALQGVA